MALLGQHGANLSEQAQLGPMVQQENPSITDRLVARRDRLKRELEVVEQALDALEGNEEAARVVNALSKLGHF